MQIAIGIFLLVFASAVFLALSEYFKSKEYQEKPGSKRALGTFFFTMLWPVLLLVGAFGFLMIVSGAG